MAEEVRDLAEQVELVMKWTVDALFLVEEVASQVAMAEGSQAVKTQILQQQVQAAIRHWQNILDIATEDMDKDIAVVQEMLLMVLLQ